MGEADRIRNGPKLTSRFGHPAGPNFGPEGPRSIARGILPLVGSASPRSGAQNYLALSRSESQGRQTPLAINRGPSGAEATIRALRRFQVGRLFPARALAANCR
jgi:hypothetical protein